MKDSSDKPLNQIMKEKENKFGGKSALKAILLLLGNFTLIVKNMFRKKDVMTMLFDFHLPIQIGCIFQKKKIIFSLKYFDCAFISNGAQMDKDRA